MEKIHGNMHVFVLLCKLYIIMDKGLLGLIL